VKLGSLRLAFSLNVVVSLPSLDQLRSRNVFSHLAEFLEQYLIQAP